MGHESAPTTFNFDPEHVLDEWRRFYDWAVLSRKRVELVEAIGCLGQQFSALCSAYRLAKKPPRRQRLAQELLAAFEGMYDFYRQVPDADRLPLTLSRQETAP
jgi:hypothetical protein